MNKQKKPDFKLLLSSINNDVKIDNKSIYFMHIPKCGGTTIDSIFHKHFYTPYEKDKKSTNKLKVTRFSKNI